jgi:predicted RNase H-like nuclease (RuvC/YqgF family)
MRRKYKLTGCARFLIFLLIFTPLVLIGVSLYNGVNPIEKAKELLNIETTENVAEPRQDNTSTNRAADDSNSSSGVSEVNILKNQVEVQQNTIDELKKENTDLKNQIKEKDREIQNLKQQLGNE